MPWGAQYEVLSTDAGPTVMQHIQARKLKPLAVGAPQRLESLPEVPTLAELGFPEANSTSLFGIFAPANVPAAVLQRLNQEFNKALASPDTRPSSRLRTMCQRAAMPSLLRAKLPKNQQTMPEL